MTKLLSNLTEDAVIVNVFNHTVLQGADGITATVDLPSLEGSVNALCFLFDIKMKSLPARQGTGNSNVKTAHLYVLIEWLTN